MTPAKPKKETDTIEAATSVMGKPLNASGASQFSMRERTPANNTIASMKPRPEPREFTIEATKSYYSSILSIVTPKTAQLVVISGRYTPRVACSEGTYFFKAISTSCTKAAITRMKTMVCI